MSAVPLIRRSLSYYARTHAALALGCLAGAAALTGALLVGDSMRGSLRDLALRRIGRVEAAVVGPRYFTQGLVARARQALASASIAGAPGLLGAVSARGAAAHADSGARAGGVSVWGVEPEFFQQVAGPPSKLPIRAPWTAGFADQTVALSRGLADELGARVGDDVLLRVVPSADVSGERLLGRRDDATRTARLTVVRILAADEAGEFGLSPEQRTPRNAFVPLATLQRLLDREGRINTLLALERASASGAAGPRTLSSLESALRDVLWLADYGLTLRVDPQRGYVSLESRELLLLPAAERAAVEAATALGAAWGGIISYLANSIERADGQQATRSIPYSTVAGAAPAAFAPAGLAPLVPGEVWLNEWAARDLSAAPGDTITLRYYVAGRLGRIEEAAVSLRLAGILPLSGAADDPGFVPEYPGVTDAARVNDWDPPFPIDLKRVRPVDEQYWDDHRTTPKAFVTLADAERLWTEAGGRFGRWTAVRFRPPRGIDASSFAAQLEAELLRRLPPAALGLAVTPVRANALAASRGATDFGSLFLGLSAFVVLSAAMLVALLFRLSAERRSAEVGLLLALGYSPQRVARLWLAEGAVVAAVGVVLGQFAALGYAWLMLAGLRTWWSEAARAPFLTLHAEASSLLLGEASSFLVALLSMLVALRGLTRRAPRELLAGVLEPAALEPGQARGGPLARQRRIGLDLRVAAAALGLGALFCVLSTTGVVAAAPGFFGCGGAVLVAAVAGVHRWLSRGAAAAPLSRPHVWTWVRMGLRNAPRHRGRSMLIVALLACASFLVVSLAAFRLEGQATTARDSGSGGFSLWAESDAPLLVDLSAADGQEQLGLSEATRAALHGAEVFCLRLRSGDAASCTNLYQPRDPRILGATAAFQSRGGFAFASVLDWPARPSAPDNPWTLLEAELPDGAVPAIGDAAAVMWQLKLGLGRDLEIVDERGQVRRLRFVALLAGSMLQDEVIVGERAFEAMFPSVAGYRFFLIAPAQAQSRELASGLERELSAFGFDVSDVGERLRAYRAVQNTYLETFGQLGSIGMLLGTLGLAAVVLRNVWERRRELALMTAVGLPRSALRVVVLSEVLGLVLLGLLCGSVAAFGAVGPLAWQRPAVLPGWDTAAALAAVAVVAAVSCLLALRAALGRSLIGDLRRE